MDNLQTKICKRCKIEKGLDEFYLVQAKGRQPARSPQCKLCQLQQSKIKFLKKQELKLLIKVPDLDGEIWVDIIGYENYYMVSNLARVKRKGYWHFQKVTGRDIYKEERLLSMAIFGGYHCVTLYNGKVRFKNPISVYTLVFFSFNKNVEKKKAYEVDHIDNDKLNSKLSNLQYIKSRQNSSKRSMNLKKTSRFTGVSIEHRTLKWQAHIRINGKSKYLGRFYNEIDASIAYQKALQSLENKVA